MKSFFTLLLAALAFAATAQPQKIHYQGVAVGANGKPLKNSTVGLRLSVIDSLPTGSTLYTETQAASIDSAGMFSIYLGAGTATVGTFANLPWANGNDKFLKVEMDTQGGSNYQPMGTTQLVSVPYAMAAGNSKLISDQFGNSIQIKYDGNGNPFIALVTKPIVGCNGSISIQGESYPIVQIGSQCWMAKNLNVGTMMISSSTLDSQRNNGIIEKYCYNNDPANCVTYGGLYQWAEAVQYLNGATNTTNPSLAFESNVKGICPVGWHIPNDLEWGDLEIFLGGSSLAGGALKSISSLWIPPAIASNRYGFSILPAGVISPSGGSFYIGNYAYFWTSTTTGYSNSNAYYRDVNSNSLGIERSSYLLKENAFSIRCILDTCNPVTQANAGADQLNVCASSVTLAGNSPSNGTAAWSILSGAGGSLGTPNAANTTFTGTFGNSYTLRYCISNACGSSDDTVAVSLTTTPANAGPDQLSISGTTATLAANAPASGETGAWSMVAGNGGSLNSSSTSTTTFNKGTDSSYTLVWTISGDCGSRSDTVILSFQNLFMNVPCPGIPMVTYAGESYPTVQIGTQCWFAKNLNVGTMINSSTRVDSLRNNGILEKYCCDNDTAYCAIFGGLYQWAEAVQYQNGASNSASLTTPFTGNVQGICPSGWHIPKDVEWNSLETTLGGSSAGGALKTTSWYWGVPNTGATNSSGFSALPGGFRSVSGGFQDNGSGSFLGFGAYFWSSSESSNTASTFALDFNSSDIYRNAAVCGRKEDGLSVRCLMDSCSTTSSSAGPDQLSLTGTTATLAANAPAAGETGTWSIFTGSGGSLNANNNPTATFTKGTDSAYTLVWTLTGPCGTSQDTVNLLFPASVGTACGLAVTYAGETYPTVQIGTQCWFAKNLNVGTMINSSAAVDSQNDNGVLEKYCYNNDIFNCATYGGLYQWAEAVQYQNGASNTASLPTPFTGNVRGICPTGWHLPSDAEWSSIETTLGGRTVAGGALKSTSGLWQSPNTGTNSSGFSALPGGLRNPGLFYLIGYESYFWSSSESSSTGAIFRCLYNEYSVIDRLIYDKDFGFSVRCIKD